MRIAAIDIGTNTALLLIADVDEQSEINPVKQEEKLVRLGQGVDQNKNLNQEAITRTLTAVRQHIEIAAEFGAEQVLISGTSAVRDAANRGVLLQAIMDDFGIALKVLSGEEEAKLTYFGALSNTNLTGDILVVDIGGGSTEFIVGTQKRIKHATSLNIGSVRLTERFVEGDPISDTEYNSICETVHEQLTSLEKFNARQLLGIAGTVTTLAAMHLQMDVYDSAKIENSLLTISQVEQLVNILKGKRIEERKQLPGLKPERADVILAGGLILLEVMQYFGFREMLVSDRGVRFGLILQALGGLNV